MNMTKSNKMKTLAVGAAMTLVLGAGVAAVLMPSMASAAVARQGSDDTLGHVRIGVAVGHARHSGLDDVVGHARHGADDGVGHL